METEAIEDSAAVSVTTYEMGPPDRSSVVHTNRLPMPDEEARRLERAGAIAPPYPPHWLAALYENSTALRPAVEALEANVDGHGHRFQPRFPLEATDVRDQVRDALLYERMMRLGGLRNLTASTVSIVPSELDIDVRIGELRVRMRLEKMRLDALFSACCPGGSFVRLRKQLRRDLEVMGNAYLGVRRNNGGDIAEFEYLPGVSMRLRPMVLASVPVDVPVRKTPITIEYETTYRDFRTFVQFGLVRNVFFKQMGDPRIFCSRTGRMVENEEELRGAPAATEVVHLKIDSALSEYGVPRWIAASPVVAGLRASQEVNANHFQNNGIPRMLFLVSGGSLKDGADKKLSDLLRGHAKGIENYGAAVILQATPATGTPNARVQIEAKSLKEAIPDDGLFLNYGARCRDETLSQFRLPKFVTGQLDDVNRSTAEEGLAFVEDQVFQPMRHDFDVEIDAMLQGEGVLFWRFVSNSPISRKPEIAAKIASELAKAGGLTVNDVRRVTAEITNAPHPPIESDWADLPFELAKLAFAPPPGGAVSYGVSPTESSAKPTAKAAPVAKVSSPKDLVEYLLHARRVLERGEKQAFAAEFQGPNGPTLVLPLSGDQLAELVEFA